MFSLSDIAALAKVIDESELLKNLTNEPSKEVGKGFADIVNLVFSPFAALRVYKDIRFENFIKQISEKYQNIPESQLIEPKMSVLGPALEASKYCFQEDELREMFATLIAHTVDKRVAPQLHPAFAEILKQLSPLDAKILASFRKKFGHKMAMGFKSIVNGEVVEDVPANLDDPNLKPQYYTYPEQVKPIANYWLKKDGTKQSVLLEKNILLTDASDEIRRVSASITNLLRLGMIDISYTATVADSAYDEFYNSTFYKEWIEFLSSNATAFRFVRGFTVVPGQFNRIDVERGIVRLTGLGFDFISCCVIEQEVERGD